MVCLARVKQDGKTGKNGGGKKELRHILCPLPVRDNLKNLSWVKRGGVKDSIVLMSLNSNGLLLIRYLS